MVALLLSFKWPRVYGFDFSGTVVATGGDKEDPSDPIKVGSEVFGMISGLPQRDRGTLAEYVLVSRDVCAIKPPHVRHLDAAAVPLVSITAVKMFEACNIKKGAQVFITGGAGGMGTAAIQLAKCKFGAKTVTTTASPGEKTDLCKKLGADVVVDYRSTKLEELEGDYDVILDCTGEAWKLVHLLGNGGGMCSILAGPTATALRTWLKESNISPDDIGFGIRQFLMSEIGGGIFGWVSGGRSLKKACEAKGASFAHVIGTGNGSIMTEVAKMMGDGVYKAVIDSTWKLDDSLAAIERQMSGRAKGKVVVNVVD